MPSSPIRPDASAATASKSSVLAGTARDELGDTPQRRLLVDEVTQLVARLVLAMAAAITVVNSKQPSRGAVGQG